MPISKKRSKAKKDKKIDYSDIPETDATFWADAELRMPESKKGIYIRLDQDVLDWLRKKGPGYQTRINAILRTYMEARG